MASALKLQHFDSEAHCSKGDEDPADYLSRHLQGSTPSDTVVDSTECYINFVTSQTVPKALGKEEVIASTSDVFRQAVILLISKGRWDGLRATD